MAIKKVSRNGKHPQVSPQKQALLEQLEEKQIQLEIKAMESYLSIFDDYDVVSRAVDRYVDDDGTIWRSLTGSIQDSRNKDTVPFTDEAGLSMVRCKSRMQYMLNGFATNLIENRINYTCGAGFKYRYTAPIGQPELQPFAKALNQAMKKWRRRVNLSEIEQETVRRADRDGEGILRAFALEDGDTELRFIEPEEVRAPKGKEDDDIYAFGVEVDPQDRAKPVAYHINGERVKEADIIHVKLNVDDNVRRGLPTTYPVHRNLDRADKILRNMSTVTASQAGISMIRRHDTKKKDVVKSFLNDRADYNVTNSITGRSSNYRQESNPRILDANKSTEYEFPIVAVSVTGIVANLQAELRAIAASRQMPEFMLTSDASNANYSSTMVAEGPAVRSFERLQSLFINVFSEIYNKVALWMIYKGKIDKDVLPDGLDPESVDSLLEFVVLKVKAPRLATRNKTEETKRNQILKQEGIISPQTWSDEEDLDFDEEQQFIDESMAETGDDGSLNLKVPEDDEEIDDTGDLEPDPTDSTETDENGDPIPTGDATDNIQQTALNGAQITSLIEITTQVVDKAIPPSVGKALITAAFPTLTAAQVNAIVDPLATFESQKPTPPPSPFGPGQPPPNPNAPKPPAPPKAEEDNADNEE